MTWGRGSTRASRALRQQVLADWPTCYIQGPHCTQVSTCDDHVVPLSQGGSDDYDNHRGACQPCHDEKSERERRAGMARRRATKTNRTEAHPGVISPDA